MSCTRARIVAQAQSWLGCKEADGSHKKIIDTYNSHTPRARGYKLKYSDPWCSGFVSACAIACGATDIIPTEVGVGRHIALFKKLGIWVEDDDYVPMPGDIIVYYWKDSGKGQCKSGASHIGIVETVQEQTITVIEGNYGNCVKRRKIQVNGRYIRGFAVPKYGQTVTLPVLARGDRGDAVQSLQRLLEGLDIDGSFGPKTQAAVENFQKKAGLPVTAVVDGQAWEKLLGVGS